MSPLLQLPPAQPVWTELADEPAALGFRSAEACQMATSFWPGAEHLTAQEQALPAKKGREALDASAMQSTYWRIEKSQGIRAAIAWWRVRQPELPFPVGGGISEDELERMVTVVSRRSAVLEVGPGVLGVRWSSADNGKDPCEYGCRCCKHVEACECEICQRDDEHAKEWAVVLANQERTDTLEEHVVREFSLRSKGRLMRFIASVAWAEMRFADERLVMLTLTYPGDWRSCCPDPAAAIAHLDAFAKRFERATGRPLRCVWVREFQQRGAPHFHLLVLWPSRLNGCSSKEWLSEAWYEVVGSGDEAHLKAGTRLDWEKSLRGALDSKRVAAYFAGYVSAASKDKAYQHRAPEGWRNDNGSVGGFWGRRGVTKASAEVAVTASEVIEMKRLIRRMIRSQKRTVTLKAPKQYVNRATGEIINPKELNQLARAEQLGWKRTKVPGVRQRNVARRWRLRSLTPQGPSADGERGFNVFSNDAPALAIQLARAVHQIDQPWPKGQPRALP